MSLGPESYDVCIIGASIAGNFLCYLISKLNLKIAIIEDHEEIGKPLQCAGIVSQKLAHLIDLPQNIILNRVKVAKLVSPSGNNIKLSGNEEPFIIDRIGLDNHFYDLTRKSPNVSYFLGERFKSFSYIKEKNQHGILITTSKRAIITKILVGCDGPLSVVGRQLKIRNNVISARQIRIKGNFNEKEAVLHFNPAWKELFGWIVPEGNNVYRIGLASSRKTMEKYNKFLKIIGINQETKISQQGGLIPYGLMKRNAFNNVLLLGDAACQVKSTTGGGIVMLLTAAKYAAICIKKCFNKRDFSRTIIRTFYEKPCKAAIGRNLKIHYIIRLLIENFREKDYDAIFKILKAHQIEEQISIYGDMDFPRTLVSKLLRNSLVLKFLLQFFIRNPILPCKILFTLLRS